jgi:hypothetical protein
MPFTSAHPEEKGASGARADVSVVACGMAGCSFVPMGRRRRGTILSARPSERFQQSTHLLRHHQWIHEQVPDRFLVDHISVLLLRGALILMLSLLTSCSTGTLKSRGTLVADIGMTFDEVIRKSTLKLKPPYHMEDGTIRDTQAGVFDYRIGYSGMVFPPSRYYSLVTRKHDPEHIEEINIGITPRKMPMTELENFQRKLQEQLDADGWIPGH